MGLCCPMICLRWAVMLVSAVVSGCGGLIVWLGRRLQQQEITDGTDVAFYPLVIIAFAGWLITIGFLGLISGWRRFPIGIALYAFFLFITTLVLIALGGVGLHIAQNVDEALNEGADCRGNDYLSQADDAVVLANEQLCTEVCPCEANVDTFGEAVFANMTIGSASRIQDCSPCTSFAPEMQPYKQKLGYCSNGGNPNDYTNTYFSSSERRYFPLISMLERQYTCSGICTIARYYAFTNVTHGVPAVSCRVDLQEWVQKYPLRYCAVVVSVSLFLLFNVVVPCCYVFHPTRAALRKGYNPTAANKV